MKNYRRLIPLVAIPLLLISAIVTWFSPLAVHLFQIHWLLLVVSLIIAFGPWGKQRLAANDNEAPRYQVMGWLGRIFLLQLSMSAIFLGISTVCGQTAPVLTHPQSAIFQQSLTYLLVNQGLFPWALFGLIAAGFGYYAYCRQQDAFLAITFNPLTLNTSTTVTINFIARLVTLLAYGCTLGLISLLWASIVTATPVVTGFSWTPMLLTLILLLLSFSKFYRHFLLKLFGKEIPLIIGLFVWVIFLAVAIWLLNGLLAPITHVKMQPPSLLNHWLAEPWRNLWLIFANSWWLLWAPLMGVTLAYISRGYRIRELILAILGLPLIFSIVLGFTQHFSWQVAPLAAVFIAGAGLLGLLLMTLNKPALPRFILAYLPQNDHYKFRSYSSTMVKAAQIALIFLFIYLPSGMTFCHWWFFAAALPVLLISLAISLLCFKAFK